MLKISFIVCVLFSTAFSFSQKKIEASKTTILNTDTLVFYKASMEPVNGIVYDLFEDGKTKYQYSYLNGKKHGLSKSWYANEQLEQEVNYLNGKRKGYEKWWYETGQLKKKALWENDELIELFIWYNNGQPEFIGPRKDKFGNEKTTFYFPNGLLQEESHYKNEKQHGTQKSWHDNGQLKIEANYVEEKRDGKLKMWTNEGFLYGEYSYSKDKKNGVCKERQLDGKQIEELWNMDQLENQKVFLENTLIAEFNFSNGKMNGTQTIKDNNGKNLILQENYKEGNYDGCQKKWFENGQLEREENYIDGKKIGWQRYFDFSGKLLGESNLIDGTGKISVKYANGQRAFEENYLNGELDGLQKSWYKNGQIAAEYNFVGGKRVGLQTAYNEKGAIVEEGNLIDGNGVLKAKQGEEVIDWEFQNGYAVGCGKNLSGYEFNLVDGNVTEINFIRGTYWRNYIWINGKHITHRIEKDRFLDPEYVLVSGDCRNCESWNSSFFLLDKNLFNVDNSNFFNNLYFNRFVIKGSCYDDFGHLIECEE